MKHTLPRITAWLLGILSLSTAALHGQSLQIENDYRNVFSQQSTTWPPPPPLPAVDPRTPTPNQYNSGSPLSGWQTTRILSPTGTVLAGSTTATEGPTTLVLPSARPVNGDGSPNLAGTVQLESAVGSRVLVSRAPTYFFGDVIPRPTVGGDGQLLASVDEIVPEPENAATGPFYYSESAGVVFATQPGLVPIVWRYRDPSRVPSTFSVSYVISTSPNPGRAEKRVFWTEKGFKGPQINVPTGAISQINVLYNPQFPATVTTEYRSPFAVAGDPASQQPPELRTMWFSAVDRTIRAYNATGRVFVEYLGAQEAGSNSRKHLGSEVVEVIREVPPGLVRSHVGDKLLPPDGDTTLQATVLNGESATPPFVYQHAVLSSQRTDYYAVATTNQPANAPNQPSGEVLMYWNQPGEYGILWPKYYVTYIITWPVFGPSYTQYARHTTADGESLGTAVSFEPDNSSVLVFQDDTAGQQADVKDASKFFTTVSTADPDARALVRHTNGENIWFERVHSKLATTFDGYSAAPTPTDVGARIEAPAGHETGLGYVHNPSGSAYDTVAYKNPFVDGIANARTGAIIGVNALANKNVLEVWWLKANTPPAGSGIKATYYPSLVQKYALRWPTAPAEIVLASNAGSGSLPSLQTAGTIYVQNEETLPGFNPNDEHALMAGGQVWAVRDDLGTPTTSEPYVLLRYKDADNRPSMNVFKVLREKPDQNLVFRYPAVAGTIVQAPMPLPILPLPFENGVVANRPAGLIKDAPANTEAPKEYLSYTFADRKGTTWVYRGPHDSIPDASFAMEFYYTALASFYVPGKYPLPAGTVLPYLRKPSETGAWKGDPTGVKSQSLPITFLPKWPDFAPQLRIGETLTLPKYGLPAMRGQTSVEVLYQQSIAKKKDHSSVVLHDPTRAKYAALGPDGLTAMPGSVVSSNYRGKLYFPNLPPHLSNRFYFEPNRGTSGSLVLIGEFKDETLGEDYLLLNVLSTADIVSLKKLCSDLDTKKTQWNAAVDSLETIMETFVEDPFRTGTYIPVAPMTTDALDAVMDWVMNFEWAKIDAAEDIKLTTKAAEGATTLQLSPKNINTRGNIVAGDVIVINKLGEYTVVTGDDDLSDGGSITITPALKEPYLAGLDVVVRLTTPVRNATFEDVQSQFPASQAIQIWQWVNTKETLAFMYALRGRFRHLSLEEAWDTGRKGYAPWLSAQNTWKDLVTDANVARIKAAIGNRPTFITALDTAIADVKKQQESLKADLKKKVFKDLSTEERGRGVSDLAAVTDRNIAVDSYALTAAGGGAGWVVLVTGNGQAFTPEGEPVSMHVVRVTPPLARGEMKVIAPANPLSESLTLQQSLDYAAAEQDYEFEWRYSPPVDGLPPVLFTFARNLLVDDGSWNYTPSTGEASTVSLPGLIDAHASGTKAARLERTFELTALPLRLFVSVDVATHDGVQVLINDSLAASYKYPGKPDTSVSPKPRPDFVPLSRLMEIPSNLLRVGQNKIALVMHTTSNAGARTLINARLEAMQETANLTPWLPVGAVPGETAGSVAGSIKGKNRHVVSGPGIFTLTDNYFTCRYRATDEENATYEDGGGWSKWTEPQLAEGWIKRALAGINPFEQRLKDLYNNAVNTDVSLLTQAGKRWEGDIALNLENINQFGLIEIYETILRRGKALSIEGTPALSYGPANDALLLAAGYLNDLYMLVGNEAYADAANPTIAFNTDSGQFGDVATSLFAFKGQLASVLDEELSLLRGRDDFLPPGVRTSPVYNRLVWNFTRGIDSGEAIYALNYNIKDLNADGAANGVDAASSFPQGHGDAYGHYLTAVTGYYSLLRNSYFDWVPRSEAVLLLGKPVAVDYLDERKFATAAAALGRTTAQVIDLTYRKAYNPAAETSPTWTHLQDGRLNNQTGISRSWGVDDWATRGGQGSLLHWVTANSTLPDVDPDPNHEGIQKIDRTTVPELMELVSQSESIQQSLDNADARLNPLGLSGGALPFDISPSQVDAGKTHFEQIYERATDSLRNAVAAFTNAKSTTQLLRSQDENLTKQREAIQGQERAFLAQLVDLYGTPYAEDMGAGKTYAQGYTGPDYFHYMYVDMPELFRNTSGDDAKPQEFTLRGDTDFNQMDVNDARWGSADQRNTGVDRDADGMPDWLENPLPTAGLGREVKFSLDSNGMYKKPDNFARRSRPGRIQDAISELMLARLKLFYALEDYNEFGIQARRLVRAYNSAVSVHDKTLALSVLNTLRHDGQNYAIYALQKVSDGIELATEVYKAPLSILAAALPKMVGTANDVTAAARAAFEAKQNAANLLLTAKKLKLGYAVTAINIIGEKLDQASELYEGQIAWEAEHQDMLTSLKADWEDLEDGTRAVDQALRAYDNADRKIRQLTSEAQRILEEREVFRKKSAALIQGFRTKDFGFRAFRNEALESYKALFDLSARYTFLAARAYDYETGLANATGGPVANTFFQNIVQARALGVITSDGRPQNAGSQGGDPGLTGALARMNSDWSVVKTRLGFNNPDRYRTTFSLRRENERVLPSAAGDTRWGDVLAATKMDNILEDDDVRRYCMQVNASGALSEPGFVIPFQTTISAGFNFFGKPLAAGDSRFSSTSFATKIRSVGVAFNGYVGMVAPNTLGGGFVGQTPLDPNLAFTDPNALSATPYVYLIAAGVDSMRSPPIGDQSIIRNWQVEDQAIPLPFDIGGADTANSIFTPGQSLREVFTLRKHQAFRAVPDGTVFSSTPGFTNARLIGRSVWNSRWKLVIPGRELLADPVQGMQVFQRTVKDIKIHLDTYSYSGN